MATPKSATVIPRWRMRAGNIVVSATNTVSIPAAADTPSTKTWLVTSRICGHPFNPYLYTLHRMPPSSGKNLIPEFDYIFSSPYLRALQTAKIIASVYNHKKGNYS